MWLPLRMVDRWESLMSTGMQVPSRWADKDETVPSIGGESKDDL